MAKESVNTKTEGRTCGLIMPISSLDGLRPAHWEEVKQIITSAVEGINDPKFIVRLVSDGDDAGVIHKRIIQNVYSDDIAICDVSSRNANVMFELGMRLAFDKPTVIIKDDETSRIFDTDVIEYVSYPRDLRHGAMETFKTKLVHKLIATHNQSPENSFLKSFGSFKTIKLDETAQTPTEAVLTMVGELVRKVDKMERLANAAAEQQRIRDAAAVEHQRLREAIIGGREPSNGLALANIKLSDLYLPETNALQGGLLSDFLKDKK